MRYYQGNCHTREEVEAELRIFREQKDVILSLPSRIQGLDARSVKYCTNYLKEFYDIIDHPKKLENQIIRHCDQWPVSQ
jgi:hypothetical protein